MLRGIGRARIAGLALLATLTGAVAAPLDQPACDALDAELTKLVAAGAQSDFDKGPSWGKVNLTRERLSAVRRLIEVNEQLAFRCNRSRIAVKLKQEEPEEDAEAKGGKADGAPAPVRPARAKAPPKAKVAKPAEPAAEQAEGAKAGEAAAAKPKPKPKPAAKLEDAYSPAAAKSPAPAAASPAGSQPAVK